MARYCSKEATQVFGMYHKASTLSRYGPQFLIGRVGAEPAKVPAAAPAQAPVRLPGSTTAATVTASNSCAGKADKFNQCKSFAAHCDQGKFSSWMKTNCAGFCCKATAQAQPTAQPVATVTCGKDVSNMCPRLQFAYCSQDSKFFGWMQANCAGYCCNQKAAAYNENESHEEAYQHQDDDKAEKEDHKDEKESHEEKEKEDGKHEKESHEEDDKAGKEDHKDEKESHEEGEKAEKKEAGKGEKETHEENDKAEKEDHKNEKESHEEGEKTTNKEGGKYEKESHEEDNKAEKEGHKDEKESHEENTANFAAIPGSDATMFRSTSLPATGSFPYEEGDSHEEGSQLRNFGGVPSSNKCEAKQDLVACSAYRAYCAPNSPYSLWMSMNCAKTCCTNTAGRAVSQLPPNASQMQPGYYSGGMHGGQEAHSHEESHEEMRFRAGR